jgi:transposase
MSIANPQSFNHYSYVLNDQSCLDKLYDDRLDGFIEPDFFERKAREWRQTQRRLADQIAEYQDAAHDHLQDGIRLLELSKKAYFLFKQQSPSEKRKLLNFVCSNSTWKDQTLTATFRQPFDVLAITNTSWQKEKAAGEQRTEHNSDRANVARYGLYLEIDPNRSISILGEAVKRINRSTPQFFPSSPS